MSTITLHNESENQLNLIKSLLKEMKIKFEISKKEEIVKLSDFEKKLIQKGFDDIKAGRFSSSKKVSKKARIV
jgi:predicted transcriptional regulator